MQRLRNPIRRYAWGSRSVIARLQGRDVPSLGPEAELWVGAHPTAPSIVEASGAPLTEVIAAAPAGVLSEPVAGRFGPRLPYLLKLLAVEAPLSLQAHPDAVQAAQGYAAEEAAGVPRNAPDRRYADPYHKPELLVAVSEFRALCGFRDPAVSAGALAGLGVPALAPVVALLRAGDLAGAVAWLLTGRSGAAGRSRAGGGGEGGGRAGGGAVPLDVAEVVAAAAARPGYRLVGELASGYPEDLGVVVALLLNQVTLAPGEAIFMPAGNLHAYLHGTGVEIMAASDNVLRGGLTPKYVDVAELLRVLRCEPLPDPVRRPVSIAAGVVTWPVPVPEMTLYRVRLGAGVPAAELALPGPRTVLCLAGEVLVDDGTTPVTLRPGEAAFGAACEPDRDRGGAACEPDRDCGGAAWGRRLAFSGSGEAFVATVSAGLFTK